MSGERSVKIRFTGDSKGLDATAERSARGLARWEEQADKLAAAAGRVQRVVGAMIGPGAAPAIAGAAVATAGLAAAAVSAGAAVSVFSKVIGASQATVTEAADEVEKLQDKIEKYGTQAKVMAKQGQDNTAVLEQQKKAQLELEASLAGLDPAVRKATLSYLGMKSAVEGFVESNQPTSFGLLQRGYALIGQNVSKLQPLYDVGARAAGRLLTAAERFAANGGLDRVVNFLATRATPALEAFGQIGRNVFTFLGSLLKNTATDGQGLLDVLVRASERLAAFGTGGGLERLLANLSSNGPAVGNALVQIGQAAVVIAQALGPLAPISIAIAQALAMIIAALPPQVITALVGAWIAYTAAMTAYNVAMGVYTAGTKVASAATAAFNVVMRLTPFGLIVTGITLIVAGIVLLATKTQFFQTIWGAVWGFLKSAASAVASWFTGTLVPSLERAYGQLVTALRAVGNFFKAIWNGIVAAVQVALAAYRAAIAKIIAVVRTIVTAVQQVNDNVRDRFLRLVSFIASLPGRVASAARGLFDGVKDSFRRAINYIIDKWNGLSFSLPSINTPFGKIGGTTLSTPNLPRLASGGWAQPGRTYLTGEAGPELLTVGRRSYVANAGDTADMMGGQPVVHVYIGDRELTDIVDVQIEGRDRQTRRRAGARVAGGAYA